MTREEIDVLLAQGYDCGQIVLLSAAPKLGLEADAALALAAGFGGGMLSGETCGAVVGALIAIGYKNGTWAPGNMEAKNAVMAQIAGFRSRFAECCGGCMCRELLGYNLAIPEEAEKIGQLCLTQSKCPGIIFTATELLREFI